MVEALKFKWIQLVWEDLDNFSKESKETLLKYLWSSAVFTPY